MRERVRVELLRASLQITHSLYFRRRGAAGGRARGVPPAGVAPRVAPRVAAQRG